VPVGYLSEPAVLRTALETLTFRLDGSRAATNMRLADCHLPGSRWGVLRLATATPRTAAAWTQRRHQL
jgi:hypothetical protein